MTTITTIKLGPKVLGVVALLSACAIGSAALAIDSVGETERSGKANLPAAISIKPTGPGPLRLGGDELKRARRWCDTARRAVLKTQAGEFDPQAIVVYGQSGTYSCKTVHDALRYQAW